MRKVLHVINGLHVGGAETSLYRLVANEDRSQFHSEVFPLLGDGEIGRQIRSVGVTTLNLQRTPIAKSMLALIRHCRRMRPDIVQGWMYHGGLAATIVAKICRVPSHGWNIRHSIDAMDKENPRSVKLVHLSAKLSKRPAWIIYNSRRSSEQHEAIGFDPARTIVIPNGFDCDTLRPQPSLRQELRSAHGIARGDFVVGAIGRNHPQKDYSTFVRAAEIVAAEVPRAQFVGIGRGVEWGSTALREQIEKAGMRAKFKLLGEVLDAGTHACMFDVNVLSSAFGEGFPNVVAEGMACGVPTVATDVGDAAWVIGDTGRVAPPSNPQSLAAGIIELACLDREEFRRLGVAARERVCTRFSIQQNIAEYAELYSRR